MDDTVYIVDGNNLIYRAFFGMQPLSHKGQPTHAIYGFFKMILSLVKNYNVENLVVCFDQYSKTEKSHRYDLFPEYKANRSSMPDTLRSQVPIVHELCDLLNLNVCRQAGIEADDLISSLHSKFISEGRKVIIVSGDKDLLQLVDDDDTSVLDTMKNVLYKEKDVLDKFGIRADQLLDYLSLVGDSSDNIPGVKGIGPKKAVKLLTEFNDLDGIYAAVDRNNRKILKGDIDKLFINKANAFLSYELVSLVEVDVGEVQSKLLEPNVEAATSRFQDLGIKYLGQDIIREILTRVDCGE